MLIFSAQENEWYFDKDMLKDLTAKLRPQSLSIHGRCQFRTQQFASKGDTRKGLLVSICRWLSNNNKRLCTSFRTIIIVISSGSGLWRQRRDIFIRCVILFIEAWNCCKKTSAFSQWDLILICTYVPLWVVFNVVLSLKNSMTYSVHAISISISKYKSNLTCFVLFYIFILRNTTVVFHLIASSLNWYVSIVALYCSLS